jgi:hypothetical protein
MGGVKIYLIGGHNLSGWPFPKILPYGRIIPNQFYHNLSGWWFGT